MPKYFGGHWDFGSGTRAARAYGWVAYSQVVAYPRTPQTPVRLTHGRRIGGWSTCAMEVAQDRCRWWIPGMLKLIRAIEDAPDPETEAERTERFRLARERQRLLWLERYDQQLRTSIENGMEWARGWWTDDPQTV